MKLHVIAVVVACIGATADGLSLSSFFPAGVSQSALSNVLKSTKSNSGTNLFSLLSQTASTPAPSSDSSIRNLDATDGLLIINDQSNKPVGSRRRLDQERDYTLQAVFCHGSSNTIQSYHSYQPSSGTTPVYNPLLSSNAQGQCGKYVVVSETLAKQVGCNPQNSPNGCNQTYSPGCGGLAINPVSKVTYVARTGGRTIGRLVKVTSNGQCQSRVVDWLVKYRGKQFNGPSDVTFTSAGNLYFSDPPFALASTQEELLSSNLTVLDSKRELPFSGVFLRPANGTNRVIDCTMSRPKSIAFNPKEDTMYVANADPNDAYIKSFQIGADGAPTCSQRFFNLSDYVSSAQNSSCARPYPTGIKVDNDGFVYVVLCRNIHVISPTGTYVGRLEGSGELHNLAFSQGYLYVTSNTNLYALPIDIQNTGSQKVVAPAETCDSTTTANTQAQGQTSNDDVPPSSNPIYYGAAALLVASIAVGVAAVVIYKRNHKPAAAPAAAQDHVILESPAVTPRNMF